jgi:hypothetical protein
VLKEGGCCLGWECGGRDLIEGIVVCCRGQRDVDVVVVQSEGASEGDVHDSTLSVS